MLFGRLIKSQLETGTVREIRPWTTREFLSLVGLVRYDGGQSMLADREHFDGSILALSAEVTGSKGCLVAWLPGCLVGRKAERDQAVAVLN